MSEGTVQRSRKEKRNKEILDQWREYWRSLEWTKYEEYLTD